MTEAKAPRARKKAAEPATAPLAMAKGAFAIVFGVQLMTAVGNTGMQSVLPAIGREIGINIRSGDDFAAWCMCAMAFLGLAHTFRSGEMIRVGLLLERLGGRNRWVAELVALSIATAFVLYFTKQAIQLTYDSWRFNDMSQGTVSVPLWFPQLGYSIGLVILAISMIDDKVREAERLSGETIPKSLVTEVKHMVISHHGEYEFGSAKLPMTLEAVALHHLDNLDAKLASFTQLIKDCPNVESKWTQYHANLGRKLYKGSGGSATN